ncbi:MAG TPA: cupin domain-containing protein [Methanobacteriaceae archaeon]|nr:cupin domain-containing protein [Methanobacteriaceae archaeon]
MLIKDLKNCPYKKVQDETNLCELLHPENEGLKMGFSVAHAVLEAGEKSKPHRLKTSTEVYFILEGEALMHIDDDSGSLQEGQAVYIPPGSIQWIENVGEIDLKFLCVVSPPWDAGDDELCF